MYPAIAAFLRASIRSGQKNPSLHWKHETDLSQQHEQLQQVSSLDAASRFDANVAARDLLRMIDAFVQDLG